MPTATATRPDRVREELERYGDQLLPGAAANYEPWKASQASAFEAAG
jgi:hypothetical protein